MGRMYSIVMSGISVSAAKDLLRVSASSDAVVQVHGVKVTQDQSETSEQLPLELWRASTDGTGTSATPEKLGGDNDAAFGGTAITNLTADTTKAGSVLRRQGQNVLNGWEWLFTPEERIVVPPAGRFVVRLPTAPAAALNLSLEAVIEEIG